ncbi:glycoside hydrolase family 71 protein [Xylariaceae sp. FL1272]|nr:glycoside hydrolase family 71 protein [Xylariaceae sp. FL1272]
MWSIVVKRATQAVVAALALFDSAALASPTANNLATRQDGQKMIFCHYMIGILYVRTSSSDYDADFQRAKAIGIDALAFNIGVDSYTDQQLGYAYESANRNGIKAFISFDFNWYHTDQAVQVGQKIAQYASQPAQLKFGDAVVASSFAGDGLDVAAMKAAAGMDVWFAPNFHPEQGTDFGTIDGALNWLAWPNDGNNKAPKPGANVTVEDGDQAYISALAGKPYIAPVSPWFFTHFGSEVPYSKNWVFPSDTLWFDRWTEILALQPEFLEIVTWNDYGESHYIGRLDSPHGDDGSSKWVYGFPHDAFLDMAVPFISAFKAGASDVAPYITEDKIVYWFRPTLKSLDCDATDTTLGDADNSTGNYFKGRPNGWETMADDVFVVTLLTEAASLTVDVAGNSVTVDVPKGAKMSRVAMAPGEVSFSLSRSGATVLQGTSPMQILDHCPCGIYNFNPYTGSIPAGEADELLPAGYSSIFAGLHVSTCGPSGMKTTPVPVALADRVVHAQATPTA